MQLTSHVRHTLLALYLAAAAAAAAAAVTSGSERPWTVIAAVLLLEWQM